MFCVSFGSLKPQTPHLEEDLKEVLRSEAGIELMVEDETPTEKKRKQVVRRRFLLRMKLHFDTFSLRGLLTFVASGLDINGCVLSYFEGTAHVHCYTTCTLTTLHCSKVSFLQCCHVKNIIKYLQNVRGVLTCIHTYIIYSISQKYVYMCCQMINRIQNKFLFA